MKAPTRSGYFTAHFKGKVYYVHRLIWKMVNGVDPIQIDHINMNKQDNRISNLREVNRSQNMCNTRKHRDNTSGVKGVSYSAKKNRWYSIVNTEGFRLHRVHLTKEEAVKAVREDRIQLHKEMARH